MKPGDVVWCRLPLHVGAVAGVVVQVLTGFVVVDAEGSRWSLPADDVELITEESNDAEHGG